MVTKEPYRNDEDGKPFADLFGEPGFLVAIDFFNTSEIVDRLEDARHLGIPVLEGALDDLLSLSPVREHLANTTGEEFRYFKRGIAVLLRMHMRQSGRQNAVNLREDYGNVAGCDAADHPRISSPPLVPLTTARATLSDS